MSLPSQCDNAVPNSRPVATHVKPVPAATDNEYTDAELADVLGAAAACDGPDSSDDSGDGNTNNNYCGKTCVNSDAENAANNAESSSRPDAETNAEPNAKVKSGATILCA